MMDKCLNYTCPNCGKHHEVKPKHCSCEKEQIVPIPNHSWYIAKVLDEQLAGQDLDNDMIGVLECRGLSITPVDNSGIPTINRQDKTTRALLMKNFYLLIRERVHFGIETIDTYERDYFIISKQFYNSYHSVNNHKRNI